MSLYALPSLIGQTVLGNEAIFRFVNLAAGIVASGIAVAERLRQLDAEVAHMVQAGRNPTAAEWRAIEAAAQAAHERLQAAARAQLGDG